MKTLKFNRAVFGIIVFAFQCAMAGSYSPNEYHINFLYINMAAICLVIVGIVLGYRFYKMK